jgi:integrase
MRQLARAASQEPPKYYTTDEIRKIISPEVKGEDYKAWFLCLFLWNTGVRITEALNTGVGNFDTQNRVIQIKTLKRKKEYIRSVPVSRDFAGELRFWIKQNNLKYGDPVFDFQRNHAHRLVRKACELAGIDDERAHPHTFRHSYAIVCLTNGVPITTVRRWMGHRDLMSTLIYTEILAQDSKHFIEQVPF